MASPLRLSPPYWGGGLRITPAALKPNLDQWIIPPEQVALPDTLNKPGLIIIDDGYNHREALGRGVLHVELAAKWSHELPEPNSGRSSGSGLGLVGVVPDQPAAPAVPLPLTSGAEQPVSAAPEETSSLPLATEVPKVYDKVDDSDDAAMKEIIVSTAKAVRAKRWVSKDNFSPDTVEFWLRIFFGHMKKIAASPGDWTETQKAFVKFITREAVNTTVIEDIGGIVPHLQALSDDSTSAEHVPLLAQAICKLVKVDVCLTEGPTSENAFHEWLQACAPVSQMRYLYDSPLY